VTGAALTSFKGLHGGSSSGLRGGVGSVWHRYQP